MSTPALSCISASQIRHAVENASREHQLDLEPASLIELSSGRLNWVFTASDRIGCRRYVVRVRHFESQTYGQQFAAEGRLQLLHPLRALGVPRVYVVDETRRHIDARFAVLEYLAGSVLDTLADDHLQELACLLAALHAVPTDGIAGLLREDSTVLRSSFENDLHFVHRRAGNLAVQLGRLVDRWSWREWDEDLVISHGDVHGRNLLCGEDGGLRLIDWETVKMRHAAYDFVKLRAFNLICSEAAEAALLERYNVASGRALDRRSISMRRILWHARMIQFESRFRSNNCFFPSIERHLGLLEKEMQWLS